MVHCTPRPGQGHKKQEETKESEKHIEINVDVFCVAFPTTTTPTKKNFEAFGSFLEYVWEVLGMEVRGCFFGLGELFEKFWGGLWNDKVETEFNNLNIFTQNLKIQAFV